MTGPSTNFYIGLEAEHFTIPKRLLYYFSEYARACLEDHFSEAASNAVWLPDVDPDVFQWLWQWLYSSRLDVAEHYRGEWEVSVDEQREQTCWVLCRLYVLGERLLFDERFLECHVQNHLAEVMKRAIDEGADLPLTPAIVKQVLLDSAPVNYASAGNWQCFSLRSFVLRHLRTFAFCISGLYGLGWVFRTGWGFCGRVDGVHGK